MDNISKFISHNSKYQRLSGPLRAAQVCDTARSLANDRFTVLSFKDGLLTLSTQSSAATANLQIESQKIIQSINDKLGQEFVKKIRFKIG
jgi:predicted nucleic acid-binding Zn ribbon protein